MSSEAAPFLTRVAGHLLEKFNGNLEGVAVVFNNKRPQVFLKKYLVELHGKPLWSPELFTVQQFFSKVTGMTAASPLKQFFTLFEAYNDILRQEGRPAVTADVFYPLAETILADFSQIDYYLVQPQKVFSLIGEMAELDAHFPDFDEEQMAFMASFWSSFSPGKHDDMQQRFIELWRRMPELYRQFHAALKQQDLVTSAAMYRRTAEDHLLPKGFRHVALVGFNALSRAEEAVFKAWQDAGMASLYFDADDHYLDDELHEAGYFIRRNTRTVGLINALTVNSGSVNDPAKQIDVVETMGAVSQGKILQELLPPVLSEDPGRRAIILADESLLLPVLQAVPGEHLNVTMGYPFKQSSVFGLCDLWLTVQEELAERPGAGVSYRQVLRFLYHPLVQPEAELRESLYSAIIQDRIAEVPIERLGDLGAAAQSVFYPAQGPEQILAQLQTMLSGIGSDERTASGMEKRLTFEAIKALNTLSDSLLSLAPREQAYLRPRFLLRTIRRTLEALSVPFEGEPLSGLQVMGLLESRCLDFEEVVVVGMNEGVLPKISRSPSFIPDSIRKAFGLPVLENQNAIFAYFFYRLLHTARKVTLVYNALSDETNTGEESRFVKQLRFETDCRFSTHVQQNQPVQVEEERAITVEKAGAVWNRLQRYFNSRGGPYEDKISASAFTDYLSCPLKFFFSKLAGMKEPADLPDQIEANLVGSMLHRLMELVYQDTLGKPLSVALIAEKKKQLPELCLSALSAELHRTTGETLREPNALQQIVLQVLEAYALNILRHDEQNLPITLRELENKTDYKTQVVIPVGQYTQHVWLYGIIDRVDLHQGNVRIVDYKTGKDKVTFRDFDSLFDEEGKHQNKALLQTLFYTHIYEKVNGTRGVEPHLYTVRTFKDQTVFKSRSLRLQDVELEQYKEQFEQKMLATLAELFNAEIPFRQTTNRETCTYCDFKDICRR